MSTTYAPTPVRRARPSRSRPARPARARVPMEPKLRERRLAVAREQGRRRLHRVLAVVAVLGFAAAAVGIALSPLLDVDRIAVRGVAGDRRGAVTAITRDQRGRPLVFIDTGAVEARLEELPWVADARVARHFPGRLTVTVAERAPVAWVPRPDGTAELVDGRGVALATGVAPPPGLPVLAVTSPADRRLAAEVAALLTPPGVERAVADRVTGVAVAAGQVLVAVDGTVEVRLGAPTAVAAKVRAATTVLAALGGAPVSYVDVRVPSAPVTG